LGELRRTLDAIAQGILPGVWAGPIDKAPKCLVIYGADLQRAFAALSEVEAEKALLIAERTMKEQAVKPEQLLNTIRGLRHYVDTFTCPEEYDDAERYIVGAVTGLIGAPRHIDSPDSDHRGSRA
jgi:hypothetical protein